jgi:hypothetical protein
MGGAIDAGFRSTPNRDAIKGRSKTGRSDKSRVRPLHQSVAVRMIIVAVASPGAVPKDYLHNCLVDIVTTNRDCASNAIIAPREHHDFFERSDDE